MANEQTTSFDPKLKEGIAYFEKMLQVMPDDRVTLRFLCVAYGQIGEPVKQRRALVSLAGVLLKEKDLEEADKLVEQLEKYQEPDARAAVLRIRAAHHVQAEQPPQPSGEDPTHAAGKTTTAVYMAIKAEKKLVRHLAERKVLDESMSDTLQDNLTAMADVPGCFLVSALDVIDKDGGVDVEKAMASLADEMGAPPIPLESFPISVELSQMIPDSTIRVRGVLPFAKMGGTLLVATLNPFDADLRQHVESATGCQCKFFLAHPRTMGEVLARIFADLPPDGGAAESQEAS